MSRMRSQITRDDRVAALDAECAKLRAENEALRAIVHGEKSGRAAEGRAETTQLHAAETSVRHDSPTADKVALFRSLFRGREDVYPVRWESKAGRSGYSPACGNEWLPGICEKPRIKCADCPNRAFREKAGFSDLHVHDLRHTVGLRLREANVEERTISDILWHTRSGMTPHYSVAQVREIQAALERIADERHGWNRTLASIAQDAMRTQVPTERKSG